MPKPFKSVVLVLTLLMMIPLAMLAKQKVVKSGSPRVSLVYDMDNQDKVKTQKSNIIFADGRGMRPPPEGTVARDDIVGDPHLSEGKVDGEWAETFPMPVDEALLERGRERYDIYCSMCHGYSGEGDGMINTRANSLLEGTWVPPTNLVSEAIADRPVGHIYNTIRRGIRNMPPYAAQIPVDDRWAIVSYVRALQLSRGAATVSDLSAEDGAALAAAAQ